MRVGRDSSGSRLKGCSDGIVTEIVMSIVMYDRIVRVASVIGYMGVFSDKTERRSRTIDRVCCDPWSVVYVPIA